MLDPNCPQLLPSAPLVRQPILEFEGLEQRLRDRERPEEFVVYVDRKITIYRGDFVALLGPSGCGKTTLLTVLGLLRAPSVPHAVRRFSMWVDDDGRREEIDLREAWLARRHHQIERIRRRYLGFALQTGELLPALTVRENIAAPLRLNGVTGRLCASRVDTLIECFGLRRAAPASDPPTDDTSGGNGRRRPGRELSSLADARVNKLSGGEYQRVSLARAVAHRPQILFVDEPTASLNRELARGAIVQLQALQQHEAGQGATVMITHDEELAAEFANLTIRMAPRKDRPGGEVVEVVCKSDAVAAAIGNLVESST